VLWGWQTPLALNTLWLSDLKVTTVASVWSNFALCSCGYYIYIMPCEQRSDICIWNPWPSFAYPLLQHSVIELTSWSLWIASALVALDNFSWFSAINIQLAKEQVFLKWITQLLYVVKLMILSWEGYLYILKCNKVPFWWPKVWTMKK